MKISLPSKVSFLILLLFIFFLASFSFLVVRTFAQVPPPRVPCGTAADPEFQSLRPYQASPCGDSNKALFCGNNIIIYETVSAKADCGVTEKVVNKRINKTYVIELSETELPILGNTEQVKNSQGGTDEFDDATKVNEYLSWYLSGVNNRAEYGENTEERVVNYSGPIQKLLPTALQDAQRILTIESVRKKVTFTDTEEGSGVVNEPSNHNQIVVCANGSNPEECPDGGKLRLLDWDDGSISIFMKFYNLFSQRWEKRYPPLPWQFESQIEYKKAYSEWRGDTCAVLPIVGLVCFDNPAFSNQWANLFQYVPLANTVDKNAKVPVVDDSAQIQPLAGSELGPIDRNEVLEAPALFYAHANEGKELTELLNRTYVPKEGTEDKVDTQTSEFNASTSIDQCRVVDVRANEGDNLFAEVDPDEYQAAVDFTIVKIPCQGECTCKPNPKWPEEEGAKAEICENKCEGGASVVLPTITKTPFAENIWKSTVSGGESTFRKIFPKVEEGSPVTCIADMPTVTKAVYKPTQGTSEIKVKGPNGSGDGTDAKLYFPHIGSVYEYFLKGIQTALRPQGYGESITNGTECKSGEEAGDCSFDMSKIASAIQKAADEYDVPAELLRAVFEIESYEWIADPSSYKCEENSATAAGPAQITKSTYDVITCEGERMDDIGMCDSYDPKLSRCSIDDAFELMARTLLWKAGKWIYGPSNCSATGGISLSNQTEIYDAACRYYGSYQPDDLTVGLSQDIPESERRPDGDMNYCDVVGWKLGIFPPYP